MAGTADPKLRHFTLRRGFVIFVGLLILTLYFVWAGYGAAPTSLSFLTEEQDEAPRVSPGGSGMGMAGVELEGANSGMTPDEFSDITEKFVEDLSLPDGSVQPTRQWTREYGPHGEGKAGQGKPVDPEQAARTAAEMTVAVSRERMVAREQEADHTHDADAEPIDVFVMAMRFSYSPSVLRLQHGVPYRFHMMSIDVNHGASINTGSAGHIMRRPARVLVTMVMTFPASGEFMMYCTVYCGLGHGQMKAKIIVE
jgi:cytochrome c oxidase subunit II